MKYKASYRGVLTLLFLLSTSCSSQTTPYNIIAKTEKQLTVLAQSVADKLEYQSLLFDINPNERFSPRTINNDNELILVKRGDWTSGFYPGSLWYTYAMTGNKKTKSLALQYTLPLAEEKNNGATHDMGFKVFCSFGNAYHLTLNSEYKSILLTAAQTLSTRFNEQVGAIRSWDHSSKKWAYPVIIDNMMNLELLFWASEVTGNQSYYDIAYQHAITTMENHFRPDFSTYHVVDYNIETGQVAQKNQHQGYKDESTWSRGQAWALYGYTMCYRATKDKSFLELANNIAGFIFHHPNLPSDLIPYWDYDAPNIPYEERDVSAAAITASALYELSLYTSEKAHQYQEWATTICDNLESNYSAAPGGSKGFILLSSTGSKAQNSEVDVPLNYADYYFLEALYRQKALERGTSIFLSDLKMNKNE